VRTVIGDVARFHLGGEGANHFVVLVVNASDQATRANLLEAGEERLRRNAWEALRMGAERRELERGGAGIDKFADARRAFLRVDSCIKREVNARLCARFLSLDTEALRVSDQTAVVIGHVDDGSNAAGSSAAR